MTSFTVIGDADIKALLLNLSSEEVRFFLRAIEDCLAAYSCGKERQYQPNAGVINRPEGQKILFRPFTSPNTVGAKMIVHPALHQDQDPSSSAVGSGNKPQQGPLHGGVVLCDQSGHPTGFLNAEEITGYRTTLNAMIPFTLRHCVNKIVIFGAGKQGLWHTRLALALRGEDINSITIINRSEARAHELIKTVQEENKSRWKSTCHFNSLKFSSDSSDDQIKSTIKEADVIFCTVASQEPLFPIDSLDLSNRKRLPLITAIGSWQPDMIEIHPEILQHVVNSKAGSDSVGSIVLVDDAEAALTHSGEIVQSGLGFNQMFEIGYILQQKRQGLELPSDQNSWLAEGLVVYKSIGVSVTDLAAGNAILALAEKNNIGTKISNF